MTEECEESKMVIPDSMQTLLAKFGEMVPEDLPDSLIQWVIFNIRLT